MFFDNLKTPLFHYLLSTGVFIMPKPIILSIDDDEKTKQIRQAYNEFMAQKKAQPQIFDSLDKLKKSQLYQDMSEEEQERLKQYEGKNVIVLVFETSEQAIEFIQQIQQKNLISEEQAEKIIAQLEELNEPQYRSGMH